MSDWKIVKVNRNGNLIAAPFLMDQDTLLKDKSGQEMKPDRFRTSSGRIEEYAGLELVSTSKIIGVNYQKRYSVTRK